MTQTRTIPGEVARITVAWDEQSTSKEAALSYIIDKLGDNGIDGATIYESLGVYQDEVEPGFTIEAAGVNGPVLMRYIYDLLKGLKQDSVYATFDGGNPALVHMRHDERSLKFERITQEVDLRPELN